MIGLDGRRVGLGWLSWALSALALSCGSRLAYVPPPSPPAEQALPLQASFDEAWQAVIQTFFDRNIPVRTLEKASGLLESEELRGEIGRDCDCGTWLGIPIGGYGAYGGDAFYRFRVLVERRGDHETSLLLRSTCRGQTDRVEGELFCHLVPAKEADVRTAISQRLGATTRRPDSQTPAH